MQVSAGRDGHHGCDARRVRIPHPRAACGLWCSGIHGRLYPVPHHGHAPVWMVFSGGVVHAGWVALPRVPHSPCSVRALGFPSSDWIRIFSYRHCTAPPCVRVCTVPPCTRRSPVLLAPLLSCIVYGSTKGFVSYGGFTHVRFPLRTSVSPPALYPSSLQLPLSPLSPSPVTTFPSSSLSCSPLPRPPSPSPAVWLPWNCLFQWQGSILGPSGTGASVCPTSPSAPFIAVNTSATPPASTPSGVSVSVDACQTRVDLFPNEHPPPPATPCVCAGVCRCRCRARQTAAH